MANKHLNHILQSNTVLKTAFSADVLQSGNNSNVLNLSNGSLLVLRVLKHEDAQELPLNSVKTKIEQNIKLAASEKAMQKFILQLQSKIHKGSMAKDLMQSKSLSWKVVDGLAVNSKKVPAVVSLQAFLMRPSVAPALSSQVLPASNGDVTILVLRGVHSGATKVNAAKSAEIRNALSQQKATMLQSQFYLQQHTVAKIKYVKA